MAILATCSAASAYRASIEERKSATCEHQLGEAQTYELVQRQRYLDAAIEYQRWSDSYDLSLQRSSILLGQADAVRETRRVLPTDGDAGLLDVEAQIEASLRRTIEPVRDFTNPNLVPEANLERRLRARAKQDMKELGISNRCAVHDDPVPIASSSKPESTYDDYLDPLRQHVAALHWKATDDGIAVIYFVVVLVLLTLSDAVPQKARGWFQLAAAMAAPTAIWFALTCTDVGLRRYLITPSMIISALVILGWMLWQFADLRAGRPRPAQTETTANAAANENLRTDQANSAEALRRIVHSVDALLAGGYLALVIVAVLVYDEVAVRHTTRTFPAFIAAGVLVLLYGAASWWLVEGIDRFRLLLDLTTDVSKEAIAYARTALTAVGAFVSVVPVTAFLIETQSTWLGPLSATALGVALALATFFIIVSVSLRRRLHHDAGVEPLAVPERTVPATATLPKAVDEVEHDQHYEAELPGADDGSPVKDLYSRGHRTPFRDVVVFLIALTALCSAVLTALYTHEAGEATAFSSKAAEQQLDLMRSSSRQALVTYRTIEGLTSLRQVQLRSAAAMQLRDVAAANGMREHIAIWDHEARRWGPAADVFAMRAAPDPNDMSFTVNLTQLLQGEHGPNADPSFPARLFAASTVKASAERLALWDAYDEANAASEGRADYLLTGGSFFAIALYLFGQSLGMGFGNRGGVVLAAMGSLLVLLGVGIAAYGLTRPAPAVQQTVALPERCSSGDESREMTIAQAAALCFGRAESLTALATKPQDYKLAQDAYAAATQDSMRPNFVLAQYRSLRATSRLESPQRTDYISIVRRTELPRIVERERKIVQDEPGSDRVVPGSLREDLAFHEYLLALDKKNRSYLAEAIKSLGKLEDIEPSVEFRLSAALLATHNVMESNKKFKTALFARCGPTKFRRLR
jgi:uncharacterized protein (UPF0548 family)